MLGEKNRCEVKRKEECTGWWFFHSKKRCFCLYGTLFNYSGLLLYAYVAIFDDVIANSTVLIDVTANEDILNQVIKNDAVITLIKQKCLFLTIVNLHTALPLPTITSLFSFMKLLISCLIILLFIDNTLFN